MPSVNDELNEIGVSAAEVVWSDAFFTKYEKERLKTEKKIADFAANQDKARSNLAVKYASDLENLKFEMQQEALEEEFKEKLEFQKKLLTLERQGIKVTEKEKAALEAKSRKDKAKEEKKAKQEFKKDLAEGEMAQYWEKFNQARQSGDGILKSFISGSEHIKNVLSNFKDEWGDALKEGLGTAVGKFQQAGTEAVNSAMETLSGVYSKVSARLQASGESFDKINTTMQLQLAASPFVKYTDMLGKVEELVDSGVAYNVEQRAFLASISDKIAGTFDAFDSNLMHIIRIQQEDSTKQRLGMEARLTEFLNSRYRDTSYLSGAHDSVTEALTASIVQLGTAKGAEYEYNVQKWFGALSALGMNDNTLTGLASAINSLATGDVEALSSSEYMNLIVMAANRAGISYADMLTKGLNEDNVNDLISQIVAYWSEIATETNQVVKNQYSKLFGLDMIDMTAIKNIDTNEWKKIYKETLSYSGMNSELTEQLKKIPGRMHVSEMLDNVWDNFMTGMGLNIASNPITAATWLINDLIKDATGGINIPSFGAFAMGNGFNFDIESDVNSLIQLGMVGFSTLGQVGKIIAGLGGLGGLNLSFWGADQYNTRGGGFSTPVTGVTASTSQTTYIGNSSSSDIYDQTLNKAQDEGGLTELKGQAEDNAKKAQEQMDDIDSNVKAILDILSAVSTGNALRVKVEDYGLTGGFGV